MCARTGTVVKQVGQHLVVFKLKCKSWSCPECSRMRRRVLIREGQQGKPNRFITLTVNPAWFDGPEDRAARLAKAWRLTVAAFRHRWPGREAEYLCVFEATQKGEPHLHIMWRGGWMPQAWLSKQMEKRMGAPVVDVRWVHNEQQVNEYVTKYISKRNIKFGNCKRYWRSKNYLAKSPRLVRKERNAGARFYRTSKHIIDYFAACLELGGVFVWPREDLFEFDLPEWKRWPPWFWPEDGNLVQAA